MEAVICPCSESLASITKVSDATHCELLLCYWAYTKYASRDVCAKTQNLRGDAVFHYEAFVQSLNWYVFASLKLS